MPAPYRIQIELDGHPYSGTWRLMVDGRLCVMSPWGRDEVDCCAGTRPEPLAKKTLERIVRADQQRRAKERADQERALAALRPKRKAKTSDEKSPPPR